MTARRVLARTAVAAVVVAAAGIAATALHVHTTGQTHNRRRARYDERQVWDDPDDHDDLTATELQMLEHNQFLARDRAHALRADHEGDDLCPPS